MCCSPNATEVHAPLFKDLKLRELIGVNSWHNVCKDNNLRFSECFLGLFGLGLSSEADLKIPNLGSTLYITQTIKVMPILKLSSGAVLASEIKIQQELACLSIQIKTYEFGKSLSFDKLISQDVLSYAEKEEILLSYASYFKSCNFKLGNVCYDLLVLHPGSPSLYSLTATYSRYHTHTDAEVLYILSGEVIFGFVQADGSQIELLLQENDYIHIPPGCEHWFSLSASMHCKALRYLTTADGWIPQHTVGH